jgi:hypothetical protein
MVPELQRILVEAARREEALVEPGRTRARLRGSRWRALALVAVLIMGATAAALASKLISFGPPAASVPVFANPRAGLGRLQADGVHLLAISVPDSKGGLPWGMRVLSTTRGAGCLQVGRLLDGRLVVLGQDGAFSNDGLAHELSVSTNVERLNCSLLDGRGRMFVGVTVKSEPASGAAGVHCRAPGTYRPSKSPTPYTCPLGDERNLYYGMLGPDAESVTYSFGGQTHTVATVGDDGAYLIVTPGTTHRFTGAAGRLERAGLDVADDVPVFSPITAIRYRGGVTCHLVTAGRWIYGPTACSPAVPEPYGYVQTGAPTAARLATPIHVRLIRGVGGRWGFRVSFTSRVAIASLRGQYELQWHEPGGGQAFGPIDEAPSINGGMIPESRNISAGQRLSKAVRAFPVGPALAPGIRSGRVILRYANGPLIETEEDTENLPVGSFEIRVP